jgi:hypothetical protein
MDGGRALSLTVRRVESLSRDGAGLGRFLGVPSAMYAGDPLWVAPLRGDLRRVLSAENPFFDHAECQLFVASGAGRDVGRVLRPAPKGVQPLASTYNS